MRAQYRYLHPLLQIWASYPPPYYCPPSGRNASQSFVCEGRGREHMRTQQPTTKKPRSAAPTSRGIGSAFEWFLQLPVPVVLLVMWVGGVVLLGACVLLAYAVISAVVGW